MKNHNHNHNTHNLSVISSETCSYKNETNSMHSSYLEYIEGNKAKNEWAKLLKNISNLKQSNNKIIDEEEIDITKNYYEKQSSIKSNQSNEKNDKEKIKDKNNIKKNEKNNNIESRIPDYLKGKYHFLDNGIILRDVNKANNSIKIKKNLNTFLIQKEKGNNNDDNSIKNNFYRKLKMLEKKTPFQIKCIKKPDRSFITKIVKSTRLKPIKIKKFKKIYKNSSSLKKNPYLINNVSKPGSERLIPISKKTINKLEESKNILKKVVKSKKSLNYNNNTYNKVSSSTISPMCAISRYLKATHPDCKTVFIGPCIAKKSECHEMGIEGNADYVLTFGEMTALLKSKDVKLEPVADSYQEASVWGKSFASSGGVANAVLEVMRQPLEDGVVHIARVHASLTYPAQYMLIAAMNPCPCGNYGSDQLCTCTPGEIRRYVRKISGPLLDRIDLHVRVERPLYRELVSDEAQEGSGVIRERVLAARERQVERLRPFGMFCNAHMGHRAIRETCCVTEQARRLLQEVFDKFKLEYFSYK